MTIFEGPDCSGKSTAVTKFWQAGRQDSLPVHHGPYPGIKKMLPRLYVETMLPMLQGGQAQIWDRSWYSEPIYGHAFRGGEDRVGWVNRRHLERFALRHGAVLVLCLPPYEVVKEKWLERKGEEYLEKEAQLRKVYDGYVELPNVAALPIVLYDYTRHDMRTLDKAVIEARTGIHREAGVHSGGNLRARVVLVGDKFSDLKDDDCNWRLPFASFSRQGVSHWLTEQLAEIGYTEDMVLWVNADEPLAWLRDRHNELVVALGQEADKKLTQYEIHHATVDHPQYHKRFRAHDADRYELLDLLGDLKS